MREALAAGAPVREIFVAEGEAFGDVVRAAARDDITITTVGESVIHALSDTTTPQGVVAVVDVADESIEAIAAGDLVVVLARIRDPGNAGTLVRSAVAAGASGAVFTTEAVDAYAPKTVRASAGAVFRLPLARNVDIPVATRTLRRAGVTVIAASVDATRPVYDVDLRGRVAFVLGNEAAGLSRDDVGAVDEVVLIPMPGNAESLNVGIAGSVLLFEAVRQRRGRAGGDVYPRLSDG